MISAFHCLTLTSLFCLWTNACATKCYVCSWSPKEKNQTNYCLEQDFKLEMVGYLECTLGCEAVTDWDKNGNMTHFFRNCANIPIDVELKCQKRMLKTNNRETCSCNWHLCNNAPSNPNYVASLMLIAVLVALSLRN